MTTATHDRPTNPIAMLYLWVSRCVGGVLMIGIAIHVAGILFGQTKGVTSNIATVWPTVALLVLATMPVVSLLIAGLVWVLRDRRDLAGWMAVATALFLSSLWALK